MASAVRSDYRQGVDDVSSPDHAGDRHADVRRRILDAAHDCFERFGVGRTRIEDIAKQAGISRPLLYTYYSDRAGLIEAVINDELRRLTEALQLRIPRKAPFEKCIVDLTVASIDIARADKLLGDLFENSPYGNLATLMEHQQGQAHAYVLGLWRPLFDVGRAEGVLRTDLSDDDLIEWIMMSHHILLLRNDLTLEQIGERFRNFVVPGLRISNATPALRSSKPRQKPATAATPSALPRAKRRPPRDTE